MVAAVNDFCCRQHHGEPSCAMLPVLSGCRKKLRASEAVKSKVNKFLDLPEELVLCLCVELARRRAASSITDNNCGEKAPMT